jgi:hypothetical protein
VHTRQTPCLKRHSLVPGFEIAPGTLDGRGSVPARLFSIIYKSHKVQNCCCLSKLFARHLPLSHLTTVDDARLQFLSGLSTIVHRSESLGQPTLICTSHSLVLSSLAIQRQINAVGDILGT